MSSLILVGVWSAVVASDLLASVLSGGGVTPLPRAPLLERYFLEQPWPTAIFLIIVAAAVAFGLHQRGRLRAAWIAGAAGLALAGGVFALAAAVTTEREALIHASVAMVRDTASGDAEAIEGMLHAQVELVANHPIWNEMDRAGILARTRGVLSGFDLRTAVLDAQAALDGPDVGRTQLRVRVQSSNFVDIAWWRLDWRRDPGEAWRVVRIERIIGVGERARR